MNIRFSVIIVHFNGLLRLRKTVNSIFKTLSDNDEIIIVDNNSSDESLSKFKNDFQDKNIKIRYIENDKNKGFGFAANQGIKASKGSYFLICNNDIEIQPNTLDLFSARFSSNSKIGMISGQLVDFEGNILNTSSNTNNLITQFDGLDKFARIIFRNINSGNYAENLRGACLAVSKSMVEDIGPYDEDFFFYFEDTEWCKRARRNDWLLYVESKIQVKHESGASTSKYFQPSRIEFFRSRIIFWKKCYNPFLFYLLFIWNVSKLFLDWIFYLFLSVFYLSRNNKINRKLIERNNLIFWFLQGMPVSKGLSRD